MAFAFLMEIDEHFSDVSKTIQLGNSGSGVSIYSRMSHSKLYRQFMRTVTTSINSPLSPFSLLFSGRAFLHIQQAVEH